QFVCGVTMKVRDRLEAIASTPEACASQTPDIAHHDTDTSTLPHRFRGPVFDRPARCIKPASRDFYPNRDRDDARRGELEFYRILAFRSAAASANRGDDRNLFHRHLCGRGRCWPRDDYCRLPAFPDNERRSIRPTQRMKMIKRKQTLNAQRSTPNAQCRKGFEFDVGRWALEVGRFPDAKR